MSLHFPKHSFLFFPSPLAFSMVPISSDLGLGIYTTSQPLSVCLRIMLKTELYNVELYSDQETLNKTNYFK